MADLHPEVEVSIILPTQGRRASLGAALRSALAQTFGSFEVVVVDDAGGEEGWRTQPEMAGLLADPRVRCVDFHAGRGCAAAKNVGWAAAWGRWVCYLDDDNRYRRTKVAAQHALAVASGSPLVLCGLDIWVGARRRRRQCAVESFAGDERLLAVVADTNVLFHRRDAAVRWNETLGTVDDACLFHALIAHYRLAVVPNVPEPLVDYVAHAGVRANRDWQRFYRGQRHLVVRWAPEYSEAARRVLVLRTVVALTKFRAGGWGRLARGGCALVRAGGWREVRGVLNAAAVKLPVVRRWMVT